jgi:hypothetical protein
VTSVRRPALAIPLALAALALAACGAGSKASDASPSASPSAAASATGRSPSPSPSPSPASSKGISSLASKAAKTARGSRLPSKILVVIEENHSLSQMRAGMPFLAGLSEQYGYATRWSALTHPSEPNYLAIAGGSTFRVTDDGAPSRNAPQVGQAPSVFDQALGAGKSAATFAESMPQNCYDHDAGNYAVRHNPWVYFGRGRATCLAHDVGLSGFAAAAAANALPDVAFLIPNLVHDAHDSSLGDADAWLQQQLTPVLHSADFSSGRLVVVVTADEDDKHSGNIVLTSVLSTRLHHKVVSAPLTHYSLTRFIAQVLHQPPLGQGKDAPDMRTAFGF